MIRQVGPWPEPKLIIEEVSDPAVIERCQAQNRRFRLNSDWLQSHWDKVLPQACGKFLAVAGQEPFIGETVEEAWSKAKAAHPEDDGTFLQYVIPEAGPRIYASFRKVAPVQ